jgi:VIT1/CCC1 family predicted Fe2+/Mn2+ transporter
MAEQQTNGANRQATREQRTDGANKQTPEEQKEAWRANWQREMEGAYLYRHLAESARSSKLEKALARMAEEEEEHADIWADRLKSEGLGDGQLSPGLRTRFIATMGRWIGPEAVLSLLINDEVNDIGVYSEQFQKFGQEEIYGDVVAGETGHANRLAALRNPQAPEDEPWHRAANAGGLLREVVYGFNDGLTSNFGLVMGVVGSSIGNHAVIVSGFSGLIAASLSMAASGFLAANSQEEVRQHQLNLERTEVLLMPEKERGELIEFYMDKGLTKEEAATVADRLMEDPETALGELAREELGLDVEPSQSALEEGVVTGIATGLGAVIPLFPFLVFPGATAIWVGIGLAMVFHFLVGMGRAFFTGRPAFRSGAEMFAVGMGVAGVAFVLGQIIAGNWL